MLNTTIHEEVTKTVIGRFSKIDVLVNNAGRSQRCNFLDTSLDVVREIIDLDLIAQISITKTVLPYMVARKQGHIVGMSSGAGKLPVPQSAIYAGAKHAINGFLHSLRSELASYGIRITVICPGPVKTNALVNAFVGKAGVKFGEMFEESADGKDHRFKICPKRCALLTAISIDAKLDEVWIAKNPILLIYYALQYLPTITFKLFAILGKSLGGRLRDPGVKERVKKQE